MKCCRIRGSETTYRVSYFIPSSKNYLKKYVRNTKDKELVEKSSFYAEKILNLIYKQV